jgi:hypothetical protein
MNFYKLILVIFVLFPYHAQYKKIFTMLKRSNDKKTFAFNLILTMVMELFLLFLIYKS